MSDPWDQLPDEPDETYARFLMYRNLGPGRTLLAAYCVHIASFRNASTVGKRQKPQEVPGHWGNDSARWKWGDRATAWDIHTLHTHGEQLSVLWVGLIRLAAEKCAQKMAQPNCKPRDFMQCLAVVDKLAAFLSPDAIKSLQPPAGDPGARKKPERSAVK